ncbi:hypothetical protein SADUNF_Sadunf12G0060100 [Salix dunnii]|uniref:Amine oxidase domain-containing protein n=1 Tax=Salix dunnii TaxID=1413687 RepID=A0A835JNC1_9ROSI|nr:hypothetical protein SADUNF_Sadunf12G0060100 [Salix dunnii]
MEKTSNIRDIPKISLQFWPTGPGTELFLCTHHLENEYLGSNILCVTVTAEEPRRVEQLSDLEVEAEVMDAFKKLYGNSIPKPEGIPVPSWGLNRFDFPENADEHSHSVYTSGLCSS